MQLDSIGDWIQKARTAKGWSVSRLAREAGVAPSTVLRWERGLTRPSVPEMEAVLRALGTSEEQKRQVLLLLNATRAVKALDWVRDELKPYDRPPLIGDVIRALRWRKGWSVAELAHALQVSERTIRTWEHSESLPSDELLHQLCFVLDASGEEAAFLTSRKIHLVVPDPELSMEERFARSLETMRYRFWRGEVDGMDLDFLTLTAQAWWLAQKHPNGAYCLGSVLITHCQWLLHQMRVKEAEQYANAAWRVVRPQKGHARGSVWLIHAIARGAMRNREGQVVKPMVGAQILHDWLPHAHQWPEMEAWFLRSIAECLTIANRSAEAVSMSQSALELAQRSGEPIECHLARTAHAYVLAKVGKPREALDYMGVCTSLHPSVRVEEALLWCEILKAVGEGQEALKWLQQAHQMVQQFHLRPYEARLQQVAQAF